MTSVKWKSANILKVFGSTIKKGTFTGGKATPSGVIVKDEPTNFTPSYIGKLFENIHTHVPFYVGHDTGYRQPVGYAYKFGVTDNLDDIKYNGFVFSKDAYQKITVEGYDYVSPEIREDNGIPYLEGISFVRNPSIDGTDVIAEPTVFSKPTSDNGVGEQSNMTDVTSETPTTSSNVSGQPINIYMPTQQAAQPTNIQTPSTTSNDPVIADIKAQMEDYKAKFEAQSAKTEQLLTAQYHSISNELKGLGIEDPSTIVHGLPTEQKIAVLSKMKESIAKNKPIAQPTTSTTEDTNVNAVATNNKALKEAMSELGLNGEEYQKYIGGN